MRRRLVRCRPPRLLGIQGPGAERVLWGPAHGQRGAGHAARSSSTGEQSFKRLCREQAGRTAEVEAWGW